MNDFRKIAFGFASAEAERSRDPGLLLDGYVDYKASSDEAMTGDKYLFLGYKGSGKTSLAERLQLTNSDNYSKFVKLISLSDFPFTPFSKIIRGDAEPEAKYPTAWSWIILVYILESFARDNNTRPSDAVVFDDAVTAFRKMGLSPATEPAKIVLASAKNSFKLMLPGKFAEFSWSGSETRPASQIPDFVESLKEVIKGIRSENRHYLIIDGLDDILTARDVQFRSLSALIFEVSRLNKLFTDFQVPAKIILLCRTDVFERIPGPNKNKIRQDDAIELDWYHDPREPERSLLVQIAQIRAVRSLGSNVNIFERFFPASIDQTPTLRFLLDMTRHTPRDFLRLLTHIQGFSNREKISVNEIKSGMRDYSIKYFLPEIRDEMSGYFTPDEMDKIISSLARLRKRDFNLSELIAASKSSASPLSEEKIYELVNGLFQCSALGNIQNRPGGTTYFTFKYRNRHSSFNENEGIMLHRGMWKALNVI